MPSILDRFVPILLDTRGVEAILKKRGVSPRHYVGYMYLRQMALARRTGLIITAVFVVMFFALGYAAAREIPDVSAPIVGTIAALFGLGLGLGAMKYQQGWRLPYTNNPDNLSRGFTFVGLLNTFSTAYMNRLSMEDWEKIRTKRINPDDRRFALPFREERHAEKLANLTRMTPAQEKLVTALKRPRRWFGWSVLVIVLVFFTDGYFFAYLAWTSAALWFFLEGVIGWIRRKVAGFDVETVEVYGWLARVFAAVFMLTGILFATAGILGMMSEWSRLIR